MQLLQVHQLQHPLPVASYGATNELHNIVISDKIANMEDERPDHADETVIQFINVTGTPPHVAENYLAAHNWDLNTVRRNSG